MQSKEEQVGQPGGDGRVQPGAWLAVALLSYLYAASFVDRMILALLMDPIGRDLAISESRLSLMFGLGFGVAYVCAGLPLGHLADHGNRRRLLIIGASLWSVATALAGLAGGFATLAIARAGVGIGEAVLTPVAISMIADLFPRDRRALPTSVFSTIGAVMGSGSLIVGAGAVWLATRLSPTIGVAEWRLAFPIVALPGAIGTLAFAILIREPARIARADDGDAVTASDATLAAFFAHLFSRPGQYFGLFLGVGCMLAQAMGLVAWGSTMLSRDYGLTLPVAGATFGAAAVAGSIAGTLSVPLLLRRWQGVGEARAIVLLAIGYAAISAMVAAAGLASGRYPFVVAGVAVAFAGLSAGAVLPPLLVQFVTPPRLRARGVATYLLVSNVISLGLGPSLVSYAVSLNPAGGLRLALVKTAGLTLAAALVAYGVALGASAKRLDKEP